jgi:hypothetical protein
MRRGLVLLAAILGAGIAANAYAHGGGLDANGCHENRQTGGYHCHRGPLAGQAFGSKQEAMQVLERTPTAPDPNPTPPQPSAPKQ